MPLPLTGYVAPRLSALIAAARAAIWAQLGATLNLVSSLLGNLTDLYSARLDELAEALQAVYDAFDERSATGVYLDNLASIVGVTRIAAAKSVVTLRLTAAAGPAIPVAAGFVAKVAATGEEWITLAAVTVPGGGTNTVDASPALTGPTVASAGTITTIVTPVAGITAVTNLADAVPGRDIETDEDLRTRRRESLQIAGSASVNAIRAGLREIVGVDQAKVVENATDYATTIGGVAMAPHSYLAVVWPDPTTTALKDAIAELIWRRAPAGIPSVYPTALATKYTRTVTDVEGVAQAVNFGVATANVLTCTITVVNGSVVPADADIAAAIVDYVATLGMGEDPLALPIYQAVGLVPGVANITALAFGGGASTTFEQPTLLAAAVFVTHI